MKDTYEFYENSLKFIINNIGAIFFVLIIITGISIFIILKNVTVDNKKKYSKVKLRYEKTPMTLNRNMLQDIDYSWFSNAHKEISERIPNMDDARRVRDSVYKRLPNMPDMPDMDDARKVRDSVYKRLPDMPDMPDMDDARKVRDSVYKRLPDMPDMDDARKVRDSVYKRLPDMPDMDDARKVRDNVYKRLPDMPDMPDMDDARKVRDNVYNRLPSLPNINDMIKFKNKLYHDLTSINGGFSEYDNRDRNIQISE